MNLQVIKRHARFFLIILFIYAPLVACISERKTIFKVNGKIYLYPGAQTPKKEAFYFQLLLKKLIKPKLTTLQHKIVITEHISIPEKSMPVSNFLELIKQHGISYRPLSLGLDCLPSDFFKEEELLWANTLKPWNLDYVHSQILSPDVMQYILNDFVCYFRGMYRLIASVIHQD